VDVAKFSPRYYELIFADAAIVPLESLVVDDSEQALNWLPTRGAQTVLCRPAAPPNPRHGHTSRMHTLGIPALALCGIGCHTPNS
jgi:hypothetical protein